MSDPPVRPVEASDTIVLLSVDSLRHDRVHAERDGTPLTPTLDAFADEAVEFGAGVAPGPGTTDSVPSILTGELPSRFPGFALPEPGSGPPTIAERLDDRGFATAAFHQNNLISRQYGFDRGFDRYHDISEETREETGRAAWRLWIRDLIEETPLMDVARWLQDQATRWLGRSLYVLDEPGDSLTDRALEWLDATEGKRFLWMHYMDAHHPYLAPDRIQKIFDATIPREEVLTISRKARSAPENLTDREIERLELHYDCAVRFVDEQIGRVLERVEEDATVVVTADHGEEFFEHGAFGHRGALWEELVRVPLLVRAPGTEPRFVNAQAPVRGLVDTVFEGQGWFDLLEDGADRVVAEASTDADWLRCCRGREYKLIRDEERIVTRLTDRGEEIVDPEIVPEETMAAFDRELDAAEDAAGEAARDVDGEALREDLAALGYLDE